MSEPHRPPEGGARRRFPPPWPEEAGRRAYGPLGPLASLRALGRLLLLLGCVGVALPAYLLLRALAPRRARPGLARRARRTVARALLALLGIRFRRIGPPPPPGTLLAANHVSWLDFLPLMAAAAPIHVSLPRSFPGYRALLASFGCLVLPRGAGAALPAAVRAYEKALGSGETALFHPEATTGFGDRLLPFHPAFFEAAVRAGAPTAVASIAYRVPFPGPSPERVLHWVDWTPLVVHVWRVLGLRGAEARVSLAPASPPPADRRAAAAEARRRLAALQEAWPPCPLAPRSGESRE